MFKVLMMQKPSWTAMGAIALIAVALPASTWKPVWSPSILPEVVAKVPVVVAVQPKVATVQANEIPKGLHPLTVSATHTAFIGTPDHPTIDGGMINTTDGLPITQDNPEAVAVSTPEIKPQVVTHDSVTLTQTTGDDWATSERVKHLLATAAKEGKLDYVLKKSESMGLPASVAVVPMVESNYQTNAVSPKGAAGAWQLMPSVAKDYGISNQDRTQFTASTDTALQLLDSLHQKFGNWEYAFAAYNAGAARVQAALAKNPNATHVDELDLPQETKQYVKRLMGLNKTMMALPESSNA